MVIAVLFDDNAFREAGWGEQELEALNNMKNALSADFKETYSQEGLDDFQRKGLDVVVVTLGEGATLSGQLSAKGGLRSFVYLNGLDKENLVNNNTKPIAEKINKATDKLKGDKQNIEGKPTKSGKISDRMNDLGTRSRSFGSKVKSIAESTGGRVTSAVKSVANRIQRKGSYNLVKAAEVMEKYEKGQPEHKNIEYSLVLMKLFGS